MCGWIVWQDGILLNCTRIENAVYGKKSFLSTESDTKILQSIYFAYKVGIISSYSNIIFLLRMRMCIKYVKYIKYININHIKYKYKVQ